MFVSKNLRIILVWPMVDFYISILLSKFLFGHISYHTFVLTFITTKIQYLYIYLAR